MGTLLRKQIRLRYFDYGNTGAYYVTLCTHERKQFLSTIDGGEHAILTTYGTIVKTELERTVSMRENVSLGPYVIMPNHIHFVIFFHDRAGEPLGEPPNKPLRVFGGSHRGSLSSVVSGFKAAVTSAIRKVSGNPQTTVWQRGFYEHIIRNEADLIRITDYIMTNPITWHYDQENPDRIP